MSCRCETPGHENNCGPVHWTGSKFPRKPRRLDSKSNPSNIKNTYNDHDIKSASSSSWKLSVVSLSSCRRSYNHNSSKTWSTLIYSLLIILFITLLGNVSEVRGVCVWQGGGGFRLACGFRQSGLFRIRALGGLKGYLGGGFTIGDEDGFKDSLTNTDPKQGQQGHVQQQGQGYQQQQQGGYQRVGQQSQQMIGQYSHINEQKVPMPHPHGNNVNFSPSYPTGATAEALKQQQQQLLYLQQIQAEQMLEHQVLQQKAALQTLQKRHQKELPYASPVPTPPEIGRGALTKRASLWRWPSVFKKGNQQQQSQHQNSQFQSRRGPLPRQGHGQQGQGRRLRGPMPRQEGQGQRPLGPIRIPIHGRFDPRLQGGGQSSFNQRVNGADVEIELENEDYEDEELEDQIPLPMAQFRQDNMGFELPNQMMLPPSPSRGGPTLNFRHMPDPENRGDISHLQHSVPHFVGGDGNVPHGLKMLKNTQNFGSVFQLVNRDRPNSNFQQRQQRVQQEQYPSMREQMPQPFVEEEEDPRQQDDMFLSGVGVMDKEALATAVYDPNVFPDIYFTTTEKQDKNNINKKKMQQQQDDFNENPEEIHRILESNDEKQLDTAALHTNENADTFVEPPAVRKKKLRRRRKKFRLLKNKTTEEVEAQGQGEGHQGQGRRRKKGRRKKVMSTTIETDDLELPQTTNYPGDDKPLLTKVSPSSSERKPPRSKEIFSSSSSERKPPRSKEIFSSSSSERKPPRSKEIFSKSSSEKPSRRMPTSAEAPPSLSSSTARSTTTTSTTTTTTTTEKPMPMTNFGYYDALDKKVEFHDPLEDFNRRDGEPAQQLDHNAPTYDPRFPPNHEVNRGRIPNKFIRQRGPPVPSTTPTPYRHQSDKNSYEALSKFFAEGPAPSPDTTKFIPSTERDSSFVKFDSRESLRSIEKTKTYNDQFYSNHFNKSFTNPINSGGSYGPSAFSNSGFYDVGPSQRSQPQYPRPSAEEIILPWERQSRTKTTTTPKPTPVYARTNGFNSFNSPTMETFGPPRVTPNYYEEGSGERKLKKNLFGGSSAGDTSEMGNWEAPNFWGNIQQVDRYGPSADFVTDDNFKRVLDLEERAKINSQNPPPIPPTNEPYSDSSEYFGSTPNSKWNKPRRKQKSRPTPTPMVSSTQSYPADDDSFNNQPDWDTGALPSESDFGLKIGDNNDNNDQGFPSSLNEFDGNFVSSTTEVPEVIKKIRNKHGRRRKQKRPEVQINIKGESKPSDSGQQEPEAQPAPQEPQVILPNTQEVIEILKQEDRQDSVNNFSNGQASYNSDPYNNNGGEVPSDMNNLHRINSAGSDSVDNIGNGGSSAQQISESASGMFPGNFGNPVGQGGSPHQEHNPFANFENTFAPGMGLGFVSTNAEFKDLNKQISDMTEGDLHKQPHRLNPQSSEERIGAIDDIHMPKYGQQRLPPQANLGPGLPDIVPSPPDPLATGNSGDGNNMQGFYGNNGDERDNRILSEFPASIQVLQPPPRPPSQDSRPSQSQNQQDVHDQRKHNEHNSWDSYEIMKHNEIQTSTEKIIPHPIKILDIRNNVPEPPPTPESSFSYNTNNPGEQAHLQFMKQTYQQYPPAEFPNLAPSIKLVRPTTQPNNYPEQQQNQFKFNNQNQPSVTFFGNNQNNQNQPVKSQNFYPPSRDESQKFNDNRNNFHLHTHSLTPPPAPTPQKSQNQNQQRPHVHKFQEPPRFIDQQPTKTFNDFVNNYVPKQSQVQNNPPKYQKNPPPPPKKYYDPPKLKNNPMEFSSQKINQNLKSLPLPNNPFLNSQSHSANFGGQSHQNNNNNFISNQNQKPKPTKIPAQRFQPPPPPPKQKPGGFLSPITNMFSFGGSKPQQNQPIPHQPQNQHQQKPQPPAPHLHPPGRPQGHHSQPQNHPQMSNSHIQGPHSHPQNHLQGQLSYSPPQNHPQGQISHSHLQNHPQVQLSHSHPQNHPLGQLSHSHPQNHPQPNNQQQFQNNPPPPPPQQVNNHMNPYNTRFQPPPLLSHNDHNHNQNGNQRPQGPENGYEMTYVDLDSEQTPQLVPFQTLPRNPPTQSRPPPHQPQNASIPKKPLSDKDKVLEALETLNNVKYDVIQSVAEEQYGADILAKIKSQKAKAAATPPQTTTTRRPTTTTKAPFFPFLASFTTTMSPLKNTGGGLNSLLNYMSKPREPKLSPTGLSNLMNSINNAGDTRASPSNLPKSPTMVSMSTDAITNLFSSLTSGETRTKATRPTTTTTMRPQLIPMGFDPTAPDAYGDIKALQAQLAKAIVAKANRNRKISSPELPHPITPGGPFGLLRQLSDSKNYTSAQIATLKKLIALNNIEQKLNTQMGVEPTKNSIYKMGTTAKSTFGGALHPSGGSNNIFSNKMLMDSSSLNQVQNSLMMGGGSRDPTIMALKALALKQAQSINPRPNIMLPQNTRPRDNSGDFRPIPVDLSAILSPSPPLENSRKRRLTDVRNAPKSFYPANATMGFDPPSPSLSSEFACESQAYFPGLYADPELGCKVFHLCAKTEAGYLMKSFRCPKETVFDQEVLKCNWNLYVECTGSENKYHFNKYLSLSFQFLKVLGEFSAGYQQSNATLSG